MAEIFVRFLPVYPECSRPTGISSPVTLTQICRQWRDIALATPTLWRALYLNFGSDNSAARQLRELEAWLSRSGCCPMSVQIIIKDVDDSEYKFSSAQCARWEVLKISLPSSYLPVTEASMPLLRQLDLSVDNHPFTSNLILSGNMPLLRSVILSDCAANAVSLPWAQLTPGVVQSLPLGMHSNSAADIQLGPLQIASRRRR
ncbi:hypothetical protein C8F04DRAFT_235740 [Mycena alexandri]|uniref:F-box domain-containing protein n=1 Tax=Mycena alexandri TaxID=1745969 RepID=A0AAD6S7Y7_9AGAR|nr:hypothetical protein C8F04DRAFT_235740 [Mycena alexandri]